MDEDDLKFYRQRLDEERTREREAATPEAASTHRLLAEIYTQRLEEFDAPQAKAVVFGKERQQAEAGQNMQRKKLSLKT